MHWSKFDMETSWNFFLHKSFQKPESIIYRVIQGVLKKSIDMSMFASIGIGLSGDWGDDVLVGLSDSVLFDGSDIIVWLFWFGSIKWGTGFNVKFCSDWLISLTSNSVSVSG